MDTEAFGLPLLELSQRRPARPWISAVRVNTEWLTARSGDVSLAEAMAGDAAIAEVFGSPTDRLAFDDVADDAQRLVLRLAAGLPDVTHDRVRSVGPLTAAYGFTYASVVADQELTAYPDAAVSRHTFEQVAAFDEHPRKIFALTAGTAGGDLVRDRWPLLVAESQSTGFDQWLMSMALRLEPETIHDALEALIRVRADLLRRIAPTDPLAAVPWSIDDLMWL